MKAAVRLPLSVDPAKLRTDLDRIAAEEWLAHFNTSYFDGDWNGVALRAVPGNARTLHADPAAQEFADTAVMRRCPHLSAAVAMLQCPLKSVRLLKLTASSSIREHRDDDLGWEAGEIRLHVPIVTSPEVEFFLNGQRVVMHEGEYWYLDLSRPHRVENRGKIDRVHLVIDCLLNGWLRATIDAGKEMAAMPGVESEFDRFRRLVLQEPALQAELMAVHDRKEFTSLAIRLGEQRGTRFTPGDVDAAFQSARRVWSERWI